ncbi:MAG TPA: hypothetical protein VGO93_16970 [Candidatus Xenobia bacterium]|jgi:hypothetical protein
MIAEMMQSFLGSNQGQQALQALTNNGLDPQQAQTLLQHAANGAAEHFTQQTAGSAQPEVGLFNLLGGHAGKDALMGMVSGLLKGDGFGGAIKDGGLGLLVGHLGEYLAQRAGLDPTQAEQIAALLAPYIGQFVHEHLQSHHSGLLAML